MTTVIDTKDLTTKSPSFKPGNTILLKDGTYSGLKIKISCNGTKDARICIKAQNPGKVILTGTSTITLTGSFITLANLVLKNGGSSNPAVAIKGNNNRITGFDVSYSASSTDQMFRIEGKENRVDHNIFHDWNKSGVWVVIWRPNKTEDYGLIDHNIFKNRIPTGDDNGLESVRIGTSTDSLTNSKTIVMHNQFINCNGEIEIISNKSGENIYYRNYIANSSGTLTLRHGNGCIVYKNRFEQKKKTNSGGIRIIGENHLVANNLLRDINGNGTTRVGISITNGVKDTPINGYFQVKNANITDNLFINCSNDFAVGVKVKSENLLKPITSQISNTVAYHAGSEPCFSTNSKCLGSSDMKYTNNVFYGKTLGKAPKNSGIILKNPSEFDSATYENKIAQTYPIEIAGPQWNTDPKNTEITDSLVTFYQDLKSKILSRSI